MSPDAGRYPSVIAFFDDVYRKYERYWWQRETRYSTDTADHAQSLITSHLLEVLRHRKPGRALDVGAGEGTDAIRLALMDYEVDAVEGSSVGAEKTERFARETGVRLNIFNTDVNTFVPSGAYDVIICNGLLHYIEDQAGLIQRLQDATAPDGLNAVSLWSGRTPVPECHRVVESYVDTSSEILDDWTVTRSYKGWRKVGLWEETDKLETGHPGFGPHSHSFLKFIATRQA
jgi:2-polyprenyl-3-methyl-5-hydroxy-6-metoxy-1,4-benzoquinol methylase